MDNFSLSDIKLLDCQLYAHTHTYISNFIFTKKTLKQYQIKCDYLLNSTMTRMNLSFYLSMLRNNNVHIYHFYMKIIIIIKIKSFVISLHAFTHKLHEQFANLIA